MNEATLDTESNLYDVIFYQASPSFQEFLRLIDKGHESLLDDLYGEHMRRSQILKAMAGKRLESINRQLHDLIGYRVYCDTKRHLHLQKLDKTGKTLLDLPYNEMLPLLSPGERFLFYLCFFLFFVEERDHNKLVIFMDEPEIHLHPRALLTVMRDLYDSPNVKALWVASHSLFLVPLFSFQELVVLEDNCVLPRNSALYETVYNDLVGLEDINLFEFLKSVYDWEYYRFIVECFCPPEAVGTVDPQDEQYLKFIHSIHVRKKDRPLYVLDYGAGKCRIWQCMEAQRQEGFEYKNLLQYEAYDPYPDKTLLGVNGKICNCPFPFHTKPSELVKGKYDVVVLMNVLHEVDIQDWMQTFKKIGSTLAEDGVLLFLEVHTLTLGEQPYGNTGYLVLGSKEVSILFPEAIEAPMPAAIKDKAEKSNCWIVPAKCVRRVDQQKIKDCLNALHNRCGKELQKLFDERVKYARSGRPSRDAELSARKYAFLSQQYINAEQARQRFLQGGVDAANHSDVTEKIPFHGFSEMAKE